MKAVIFSHQCEPTCSVMTDFFAGLEPTILSNQLPSHQLPTVCFLWLICWISIMSDTPGKQEQEEGL